MFTPGRNVGRWEGDIYSREEGRELDATGNARYALLLYDHSLLLLFPRWSGETGLLTSLST